MNIKKRLLRTLIIILVGLGVGGGVGWFQIQMENARVVNKEGKPIESAVSMAGVKIGGPYTLTDHLGQQRTEADFKGMYKLIYFGFTYCPAICPTELQKMSQVLRAMPEEQRDLIQPLFFTVDPDRDTVPVMKDYVSLFHPKFIGLTGTTPQVTDVMRRYRIFATRVDDPKLSDYTIDHSTFVYFMGPDDELISIYRMRDNAAYILEDIQKHLPEKSI